MYQVSKAEVCSWQSALQLELRMPEKDDFPHKKPHQKAAAIAPNKVQEVKSS